MVFDILTTTHEHRGTFEFSTFPTVSIERFLPPSLTARLEPKINYQSNQSKTPNEPNSSN
ncbi:predicted protein [Histoplasma mississippiense (nom. inval.)]|uniref:predicted protein n=1 Tax=Ajellomyces capsulatus (strain NAm1 / WU24) TaxID=2059318 RepID=UPI000157B628|nr:predicted protein [Histoplasma mississippiense (nom. inval.)]EDN02441.1 predicted protein [Histoplasma mississippiense (nom. inval.)]